MNTNGWDQGCKSYIECHFHRPPLELPARQEPFVTLSRQAGAGGISIGRKLSAYLREHDKDIKCACPWTVFDKNLVEQVLLEHDFPARFGEFMTEDKISEINDVLEELFGLHPAHWILVRKTAETILGLAQMGHVILVGRGSNIVTRKLKNGFHVRLVGSFDKRVAHIGEYYGLNPKQAVEWVKREDSGREKYLKEYFGKNIDDPLLYDMVLNTDGFTYEEVARLIGQALIHRHQALSSVKV